MDRPSRQSCEECTFRDAVNVEEREPCLGFVMTVCNSLYSICPSAQLKPFSVEPSLAILYGLLKRNVSDAAALATHSSLPTISFRRPHKNS